MVVQNSTAQPRFTGLRYLDEGDIWSILINYSFNGATFHVLVSAEEEELPMGYALHDSIEWKFLDRLNILSFGEDTTDKDAENEQLEDELAKLVCSACTSLMRELAPLVALPEPRTLEEQLYPPTYTLQVYTEDKKLTSKKLDGYNVPFRHPPIPVAQLQECQLGDDVPVIDVSRIVLGPRLQSLVWKVEVDEEMMICKASMDVFGNSLGDELATYQKIRTTENDLRVPQLKGNPKSTEILIRQIRANPYQGIVKSHVGIIAILLGYIPHKHHSLRALLQTVNDGTVPEVEASVSLKKKWAGQIKLNLAELHRIGILWFDIKTDNVLIDDNGDAVLLDFGRGNTMGWVDQDKYGTMEGEMQGLEKILKALGEA